ncbi:MAG: hypothetical protein ACREV4_08460 [Gammaproteobacteria bacterium]
MAYPQDRVSLSGHGGEVFRLSWMMDEDTQRPQRIDGRVLAGLWGMRDVRFAYRVFDEWLDDVGGVAATTGFDVLDLLYWENRVGRWAANGQAQWDLVHERFTLFNCRALLEIFLGVEEEYRCPPRFELNARLLQHLWPELASVPFNTDSWFRRETLLAIFRRWKGELVSHFSDGT